MPSSTEAIILARVNQKMQAAGATQPHLFLHEGGPEHTNAVAALLHNVALYNAGARGEVEQELEQTVPTLVQIGLIGLFSPEEWSNGNNPGRQFVGLKAKAYLAAQN